METEYERAVAQEQERIRLAYELQRGVLEIQVAQIQGRIDAARKADQDELRRIRLGGTMTLVA